MLISKLKKNLYLLFLVVILFAIFITNYTPNTYLTGWDNLHSEFDFSLNIKRSIFSVWQEYQGVGLLGGMGHASDLFREIFLFIISPFLPQSFIRYFFHFLMLLVGTFGMYKLLKNLILLEFSKALQEKGAYLGALFYLLNLGTVQYFFVPFEPYSSFWGFFPWEIYTLFLFLNNPSKKHFLYLFLINVLAVSQAYVQTIFFVYILCVLLILTLHFFKNRSKNTLKIITKSLVVIFFVNAFWLLPQLYFLLNDVSVTQNALHNRLDTEKFFEMNKNRGKITDFIFLKEFNYDLLEIDSESKALIYMFRNWKSHLSSFQGVLIEVLFFVVVILGLTSKNKYRAFLLSIFSISAIILLSDTPIISFINSLFRAVPLLNQIFRNPFSKFIVPTVFVFSVGFGIGAALILKWIFENKPKVYVKTFFALLTFAIIFQSLPAFQGEFISKQVRVTIPNEYFNLFSFFKTQDKNARILNLPQGSFWGWGSYTFGSNGSGFLWYGIEQPILDRAFDVWSKQLEDYYWQLSYAISKNDQNLFNQVIEKYQVSFVIFDKSYIPSDSGTTERLLREKELLENNKKIQLVKRFGNIFVYKTKLNQKFNQNITVTNNLPKVNLNETFTNKDESFKKLGFYISSSPFENDYLYPYGSLFTNRFPNEKQFQIIENENNLTFKSVIPKGKYSFNFPSVFKTESLLPVNFYAQKENNNLVIKYEFDSPKIVIGNKEIQTGAVLKEITIPVRKELFNFPFLLSVNNKDFFSFNLNEKLTYIGTTYLPNTFIQDPIKIYSAKDSIGGELGISNFTSPRECEEKNTNKALNLKMENDSLILTSKNTSLCTMYKSDLGGLDKPSLLKVSLVFNSSSDEYPKYCLTSKENSQCLNSKSFGKIGFSNNNSLVDDYFESDSELNDIKFQLILEANNDEDLDLVKKIAYKNVSITAYPLIDSFYPEVNSFDKTDKQIDLNLSSSQELEIVIPKNSNSFSYDNLILNNLYKKNVTAPKNTPQKGEFGFSETSGNQKTLRIYGKDSLSQFWFKLPNLNPDTGYLLSLETKNIEGFPFSIDVFTPKYQNNYLKTRIVKSSEFLKSDYILPPIYSFDKGMEIMLMSTSFNSTPSVNDIKSISLYPLPFEYLTNIYLVKKGITLENVDNEISLPNVTKDNLSLYEVSLKNIQNGTFILSQSFHKGWKAYQVQNSKFKIQSWLSQAFPFFFGNEVKEHVLVNGWENGFLINDNYKGGNINKKLVIVFLPQYLEYFGFLLLTVPLLYVIIAWSSAKAASKNKI